MARADKAEQRQTMRADRDWWCAFGDLFGWELLDSTHRYRAKFCIDDVTTIEISARARADIEEALTRAVRSEIKDDEAPDQAVT